MDRVEQLKSLIASYWQIPAEAIDWDVPLSGERLRNFSSLRTLRFLASVEDRLQVRIEDPDAVTRFRDLLQLVQP